MSVIEQSAVDETIHRITSNPNWDNIYNVVWKNTNDTPYLAGGKLYRTLVEVLYDRPARAECVDYDFVSESIKADRAKLFGWKPMPRPGYPNLASAKPNGSLKLRGNKGQSIDIVSTEDIIQIKQGRAAPGLQGYLECVPLTVQSIAVDLMSRKLIGDAGINSILNESVGIHNYENYVSLSLFKKYKDAVYLNTKCKSLKFSSEKIDVSKIKYYKDIFNIQHLISLGFNENQIKKMPEKYSFITKKDGRNISQAFFGSDEYKWNREKLIWEKHKHKNNYVNYGQEGPTLFYKIHNNTFTSASATDIYPSLESWNI